MGVVDPTAVSRGQVRDVWEANPAYSPGVCRYASGTLATTVYKSCTATAPRIASGFYSLLAHIIEMFGGSPSLYSAKLQKVATQSHTTTVLRIRCGSRVDRPSLNLVVRWRVITSSWRLYSSTVYSGYRSRLMSTLLRFLSVHQNFHAHE